MNTKAQHTPGPWKANGPQVTAQGDMRRVVVATVNGYVFGPHADEPLANAHLIASAPALLEALEELLWRAQIAIGVELGGTLPPGKLGDAMRQAGRAILQSRGEETQPQT